MGAWKKRPSDDPTSPPPAAYALDRGRRARPYPRRPRHGGVDGTDRRFVIATVDCPCDCHLLSEEYDVVPFRCGHTCEECDGYGRVIDDDAVLQAVREVEAEAAAEAVPDTFRQARVTDPEAPPCCATPQLCDGPHDGCPEEVKQGARLVFEDADALFDHLHAVDTCTTCPVCDCPGSA